MPTNRQAAWRAFWSCLGADSPDEFVQTVTQQLSAGATYPIQLSRRAPEYHVKPIPILVEGLNSDGGLRYDAESGLFTILLSRGKYENTQGFSFDRMRAGAGSPRERAALLRARFTYAHELAHRFFYVQREAQYVRAQKLVVDSTARDLHREVQTLLYDLEEQKCNEIAGRVLLPETRLSVYFPEDGVLNPNFLMAVRRAATDHAVTLHCALVRLQHALRRGLITVPDRFAFYSLTRTNRKGRAIRKLDQRPRVDAAFMPRTVDDRKPLPIFPRMEVGNLGGEFESLVNRSLDTEMSEPLKIEVPLRLRARGRGNESMPAYFHGWAMSSGWEENTRLTLWGTLRVE